MKISVKLGLSINLMIIFLIGLIIFWVSRDMDKSVREEHYKNISLIGELIADEIVNPLLKRSLLSVQEAIESHSKKITYIRYVFVIDSEGKIVAHTFGEGFPMELLNANPILFDENFSSVKLITEKGRLSDNAFRIIEGIDAELHIGVDEEHVEKAIAITNRKIILIGAIFILIGGLLSFILSYGIITPVKKIIKGMNIIGSGNLDHRIEIRSGDEFEKLALSFNEMAEKRKNAEEAIRRNEEYIQNAQKLESIGILAGGIAHDFNNLLFTILGNISFAKMNMELGDMKYHLLEDAERACYNATGLSNRLLTFSKGGEPFRKITSIQRLLRDSASLSLSGANVAVAFDIHDNLWAVEADEGQMDQVFNNIIANAKEAMPQGGVIDISAENIELTGKENLSLKPGRYVRIIFEDHGIGIPADIIGKIFDPYFTTKERGFRKGQGLGLTICLSIIKKHNGMITVDSVVGKGTTVTIYLPAAEKEITESSSVYRTQAEMTVRKHILVMDDDERVRTVIKRMLEHFGNETDIVPDSVGAVDAYKQALETNRPYDLVILDLTSKQGLGGLETLHELQRINPDVKAIISSGYAEDEVISNFREYGFIGVIIKPYTPKQLGDLIKLLSL